MFTNNNNKVGDKMHNSQLLTSRVKVHALCSIDTDASYVYHIPLPYMTLGYTLIAIYIAIG